jgi:diaminopimelate epimerase
MQFDFYKIHGTGNDFVFIDNRQDLFDAKDPWFIRDLCRPHTGIGCDGLLLLENSDIAGFRMRYFNSDGCESEMCANGSRCISHMAFLLGIVDKKHSFEAGDGVHLSEIVEKERVRVEVLLQQKTDFRTFPVDFKLPNSISFINFLNTGVPHLILGCQDVSTAPVDVLGKALRFHSYYAPEGTNVNFVQLVKDNESLLKVRTYERGVDAETLSCGSGVTASAVSYADKIKIDSKQIKIETKGGNLFVSFTEDQKKIFLEGPVKVIFKGTYIDEEDFQ